MNWLKRWLGLYDYTSELDEFLHDYDRKHPNWSFAQLKEKVKYERIYRLRDGVGNTPTKNKTIWDKF